MHYKPFSACIVLEDGLAFFGHSLGQEGFTSGELCFTTSMTGYQHTITDPSFAEQIIIFSKTQIGNIGINKYDNESDNVYAKGIIISNISNESHHTNDKSLHSWLKDNKIPAIYGINTRALIIHLRSHGTQHASIYTWKNDINYHNNDLQKLYKEKQDEASEYLSNNIKRITGLDLTYLADERSHDLSNININNDENTIAIIDFGIKQGIINSLKQEIEKRQNTNYKLVIITGKEGFSEEIKKLNPKGILLSNGPGDPLATSENFALQEIKKILDLKVPIFGICLGHQLLALALGAKTAKLLNGHRGSNHPIKNISSEIVEITSQNHSFVISEDNIPSDIKITHRSLFDNTIAGIRSKQYKAFSVQYHPESSPGPHDSRYLFDEFLTMIDSN